MSRLRRVPAFTLVEMLVVMVLSGLVSGAIYFCYFTVSNYHRKLSVNLERFAEAREIIGALKADIEKSRWMKNVAADQLELTMESEKILYFFLPDRIVRTQGNRSDEFKGAYEAPEFYYRSIRVIELNRKIDELIIKSINGESAGEWDVYKTYDLASTIYPDSLSLTQ